MPKRLIGLFFPTNSCNLNCSYCYVNKNNNKLQELKYSTLEIKDAFAKERLGGECFINISSNGEPLLSENILNIIHCLSGMGHYVMVLTNGTLSQQFDSILNFPKNIQDRIFIKFSLHYKELVKSNLLDKFFDNVKKVKESNCSFTIELMAADELFDEAEDIKKKSMEEIGALPHISIPRDERQYTLGILSKYSFHNFASKWKSKNFDSTFFNFKVDTFGKPITWFCHAGNRSLYINMETGMMRQCYHTPDIQNFFDLSKKIKWLPIGTHCCEAHCYVSHIFMPLGIVDAPYKIKTPSYFEMRNRCSIDGVNWVKPIMKNVFETGVERIEISKKDIENIIAENNNMVWTWRKNSKDKIYNNLKDKWLEQKIDGKSISDYLYNNNYKTIAIYGFSEVGQLLYRELLNSGIQVKCIIDRDSVKIKEKYPNLSVIKPNEDVHGVDVLIITAILDYFKIKKLYEGVECLKIISIEDVIYGDK